LAGAFLFRSESAKPRSLLASDGRETEGYE
jgi:hypothetical protein